MKRAVCAMALVAACGLTSCDAGGGATVRMTSELTFAPETIHVRAGDEVVFVNEGGDAHTVTAEQGALPPDGEYFSSGGFDSEAAARANLTKALVDPDGEYSVVLDRPGAYPYYCIPHEDQGMAGVIVVEGG